MRRSNKLVEKRRQFVLDYVQQNGDKSEETIIKELSDKLFTTESKIKGVIDRG